MKNTERDVREIQADLVVVVEGSWRSGGACVGSEQVLETPSYRLSQAHADGEDPLETIGLSLHGAIEVAIGKLDETVRELVNASGLQWEEADYGLILPISPDAKPAKERN